MALTSINQLNFLTVMDIKVVDEYLTTGGNFATVDATTLTDDTGVVTENTIECLTISNITQEGPRKEVRGGRKNKPCVRWGKTMRLEMEDVVLRLPLLNTFFRVEVTGDTYKFNDKFADAVAITGTTSIIDKETGEVQDATITFFSFLPDSVLEFTMEADGDLSVVSLAGELFPNDDGDYFIIE